MKLNEKQILLVTLGEAGAYLAFTPFLNKLSQESLFFNNFFPQHSLGTSSDSELTFSTSLYPINNRTVFIDHSDKEYNIIQKVLGEKGYHVIRS